jgi:hypothetical protein
MKGRIADKVAVGKKSANEMKATVCPEKREKPAWKWAMTEFCQPRDRDTHADEPYPGRSEQDGDHLGADEADDVVDAGGTADDGGGAEDLGVIAAGRLCFVLCALCFVLCALCFVLCAWSGERGAGSGERGPWLARRSPQGEGGCLRRQKTEDRFAERHKTGREEKKGMRTET